MKKLKTLAMSALVSTLAFSASYTMAADQAQVRERVQKQNQEQTQSSQPAMQQNRGNESGMTKQGMGSNGGMRAGGGNAGKNMMPTFADFDLNNDGKITEQEFIEARTARISERAQEGRQMKGLANAASFADIDTNNDGVISPEEFAIYQSSHRQ